MVAKISIGSSVYGALAYNAEKINKEKGRVLDTNRIFNDGSGNIDIRRAFEDFKLWMPQSCKAEKTMMHISLNPHPDDRLSEMQYTQLAHEYMEKMGFADLPYLIVKHEDIDRHHIHIVALRVREDGSAVSTKNNFYRSKEITRELERKYGLHTAEHQKISPDTPLNKIDPSGDIKRQVANTVKMVGMRYKFQTIGEYNAILSLYNVKCEQTDGKVNGREYHGLVYFATDDNGNVIASPFKASRLGKFASRTAIDGRFERAKEKIDIRPTKADVAEAMTTSSDKEDFIAKLKERNIDLVLRYTDTGRIYGATFIDHNTRAVLNGSRLGKEFSANALNEWFSNPEAHPVVTQPDNQDLRTNNPIPHSSDLGSHSNAQTISSNNSDFNQSERTDSRQDHTNDFGDNSMFDGLGGLFSVGPAYDSQEEAFYREMQRRKKKKRRGPKL